MSYNSDGYRSVVEATYRKRYDLRQHRKKHNLSQRELGDLIGVSWQSVHRWEHGKHEPSRLAEERIQEILGPKENRP